uniref:Uncharacterized protein n=1 Tax=Arundo donax TaxID=35708 RepID=A0A0A8YSH6_ARUDO
MVDTILWKAVCCFNAVTKHND